MMPLLLKTDRAGLRTFGWQMSIAVLLIFMLLLPWLFGSLVEGGLPLWPGVIAAILLLLAWLYPLGLYYPYRAWMAFATVMAWFNTRLLLALVFYLMLLPLGLVLRLVNKLQYNRKPRCDSYWLAPDNIPTAKDLEDPF